MTVVEFAAVLACLLAPPLLLGLAVLLHVLRRKGWPALSRVFAACFTLVALSVVLALLMVVVTMSGWGAVLGMRDHPLPWAPFAFIAGGLALPLALWLGVRRRDVRVP